MTSFAPFYRPVQPRLALLTAVSLSVAACSGSPGAPSAPVTANARPVFTTALPADSALTVELGDSLLFRVAGADPDGSPVTYEFLVNGERVGREPELALAPTDLGTIEVVARVSDGIHTVTHTWRVGVTPDVERAPLAVLTVTPDSGGAPLAVTVRLTASDEDGEVTRYELDADGDGEYELEGASEIRTEHVFEDGGTHRVRGRVTDDEDLVGVVEELVVVRPNLPPQAQLSVSPQEGVVPLQVRVTAAGTDPDGTITLHELDADGDGVFETSSVAPIDTVLVLQDYRRTVDVTLRVVDAGGARGEATATLRPLPNVDPGRSRVTQDGTERLRADGVATRTLTVELLDPAGSPLPEVEVELLSSRNGGSSGVVDRIVPERGRTDAAGRFTAAFTTTSSSSLLGDAVVSVRAAGNDLGQTATVQFASAVSASASSLSCPLRPVHVEGSPNEPRGARVTAVIRDSSEQPLAGIYVEIRTRDLTMWPVTPPSGRTDATGTFRATVTSERAFDTTFVDLYADGIKTSAMCTASFHP